MGLAASRAWLADLDAGRYGASWEDAAPLLKGSMPKVQWETGLERARAPMGVMIARKIRQASCTRGTQGDPEAEICVIQYDSQFERRPLTDERVTVLKGKDGTWRVAAFTDPTSPRTMAVTMPASTFCQPTKTTLAVLTMASAASIIPTRPRVSTSPSASPGSSLATGGFYITERGPR